MRGLDRFRRPSRVDLLTELQELAHLEARRWKAINNAIHRRGDPTALQGFAGMEITPVVVNSATITINATEAALIPTALFPIAANPQVPKLYQLYASGTSTTPAGAATYTLTPRIGPAPTNASPLIGIATGVITPTVSSTAAQWQLTGFVLIRTGGTAAIAVGSFWWIQSNTIGGGGPSTANAVFGGISASFDSTGATALWIGATQASAAGSTYTPQAVGWLSTN